MQPIGSLREFTGRFQVTGELPRLGQPEEHQAISSNQQPLLDLFDSVRQQGLPDSAPEDWQAVRGPCGTSYEYTGDASSGVLVENSRESGHEQRVVHRFSADKIESLSVLKQEDQALIVASTIDRNTPVASFSDCWILRH